MKQETMKSDIQTNAEQIERVLTDAREALGNFCINECNAYCCRKGYLVLTPEETGITMRGREKEYADLNFLKLMDNGNFSLYMGAEGYPCPSLKDNMCSIHKDPKRSDTCRVFPINVHDSVVKISLRCPAGKTNFFYPYVARLVRLGCKVDR